MTSYVSLQSKVSATAIDKIALRIQMVWPINTEIWNSDLYSNYSWTKLKIRIKLNFELLDSPWTTLYLQTGIWASYCPSEL